MKAVCLKKYGPPDVLELCTLEKPVPNDDEILIRIHATEAHRYVETGTKVGHVVVEIDPEPKGTR